VTAWRTLVSSGAIGSVNNQAAAGGEKAGSENQRNISARKARQRSQARRGRNNNSAYGQHIACSVASLLAP